MSRITFAQAKAALYRWVSSNPNDPIIAQALNQIAERTLKSPSHWRGSQTTRTLRLSQQGILALPADLASIDFIQRDDISDPKEAVCNIQTIQSHPQPSEHTFVRLEGSFATQLDPAAPSRLTVQSPSTLLLSGLTSPLDTPANGRYALDLNGYWNSATGYRIRLVPAVGYYLTRMSDGFNVSFGVGTWPALTWTNGIGVTGTPLVTLEATQSVRVFGLDAIGQRIFSPDGEGVPLILTGGTATTAQTFASVTKIIKAATPMPFTIITSDASVIGLIDPTDTNPSFQRFKWLGLTPPPDTLTFTAICTIQFQPLINDNDLVFPQSYSALELLMQAFRYQYVNDLERSMLFEQRAEQILNEELETSKSDSTINQVTAQHAAFAPHIRNMM